MDDVTGRSPVIEGKYVAYALVLEPTGIADKFRRIGFVEIPRVQGEELEGGCGGCCDCLTDRRQMGGSRAKGAKSPACHGYSKLRNQFQA
jgi:hypothetical protein